jgi:ABC-type uncharacterized transport system permease subunit
VYTIVEIYLGIASGNEALNLILVQAIWFVILILAARVLLSAGIRRLVVLGG